MPALDNSLLWFLLPILLLGLFQVACWQYFRCSTRRVELEVKGLKQQLQAVTAGALGVGRRLQQTEERLGKALDRQSRLEQKDTGSLPYTQASKLLKMGASVDEIKEACGLSHAEASLVELLHRSEQEKRHS